MLWNRFCRAALAIAACSVIAASACAQDAATDASARLRALRAPASKPFTSEEQRPAKPTALYDKNSDEMQHFREELGKTELSTKAKKRLAEIEARVVYSDPMEKPAADGSKFINIYDESEIYADGKAFYDPDDLDVRYEKDENNILARLDLALQGIVAAMQVGFGVSSATQGGANDPSKSGSGSMGGPAMPMPTVTMDPSVAPGGGGDKPMGGDPNASGPTGSGGAQTPVLPSGPSKSDDSAALFPESTFAKETGDNPFLGSKEGFLEGDANLFKADLEFKPAPPANPNGGGYGSGNATEGMDSSSMMMGGGVSK